MSVLAGAMRCAPRLKQALQLARQDADRRQKALIDPAALLLGMVDVEDALSNRLLRKAGIDPADLRRALLAAAS